MDTVLRLCPSFPTETLKWLSSLPILMQESFWWWQCSDRYIISLSPHLHAPFPHFSPSLINLMVSVDVKHYVYLLTIRIWRKVPKSEAWAVGRGVFKKCRSYGTWQVVGNALQTQNICFTIYFLWRQHAVTNNKHNCRSSRAYIIFT